MLFDSADDWRRWQYPRGAVEVSADGTVHLVPARRNIDAAADVVRWGGGIVAGSDARGARQVGDDNGATGWNPDAEDPADDWWIELDLGRAVAASHVTLVFAENAPPLELFKVHLSTGEAQRDLVSNPLDRLVFRAQELVRNNKEHRVTLNLKELDSTTLRAIRVTNLVPVQGARLTAIQVDAIGDNLSLDLADRGGTVRFEIGGETVTGSSLSGLVSVNDGDYGTVWWASSYDTPFEVATWATVTVDLGATYWVDWMRIVGSIIPRSYNAGNERRLDLRRSFSLDDYELLASDGSLATDGTFNWQSLDHGRRTDFIAAQGWADHDLSPAPARLVRLRWLYFDPGCDPRCFTGGSMGEWQIYADGYPRQVRLQSGVLDLGQDRQISALQWSAETPAGTAIAIRSRTGNELARSVIYRNNNGDAVTEKLYSRLIPLFRGAIDTVVSAGADWSSWSSPYAASGARFVSPSPRRYVELDVRLLSDLPSSAASLDWVSLQVEDAIAPGAVSEIHPVEVAPGTEHDFRLFLRAPRTKGFDAVDVESSTSMRFIGARRNGAFAAASAAPLARGFQVRFADRVHSEELVELSFAASIYVPGTRFDAYIVDSESGDGFRQLVDAGDANGDVVSSTDVVRLPIASGILANLTASPAVITPNGDGINDRLRVTTDIINLVEGRPIRLRVFDMAGRIVWSTAESRQAGPFVIEWDGHGPDGALLPPGNYVWRIEAEGDARTQSDLGIVAIIY